MAIEPKTKADQEALQNALTLLEDEDPTFNVRVDPDTGQTLISGMGELHLEIIVDRLRRNLMWQLMWEHLKWHIKKRLQKQWNVRRPSCEN